ncbi:hypothetical protein D5086_014655 [Populus alba]|uniref:Uncharacterized protein n=1 Tax=Populus alba TaxID=43335 RepID=A0ACC4BYK1_POPAL
MHLLFYMKIDAAISIIWIKFGITKTANRIYWNQRRYMFMDSCFSDVWLVWSSNICKDTSLDGEHPIECREEYIQKAYHDFSLEDNRLNKNVGGASDNVLSTIKGDFYTLGELHRIKQGHQHGYGNIQ